MFGIYDFQMFLRYYNQNYVVKTIFILYREKNLWIYNNYLVLLGLRLNTLFGKHDKMCLLQIYIWLLRISKLLYIIHNA